MALVNGVSRNVMSRGESGMDTGGLILFSPCWKR